MKTNYEICHDFVHSTKDSERSCNVFYETSYKGERVLYSYGHHFAIARQFSTDTYFFTTRKYSVTTGKHVSDARCALSHASLIFCPYPDGTAAANFDYWLKSLQGLEKELARARNKESRASEIKRIIAQVRAYCAVLGEKLPRFVRTFAAVADKVQPRQKTAREIARENRKREEERKKSAERVKDWEDGKNVHLSYTETEKNVPLRIEPHKGYYIIKTAKGVSCNIQLAKTFYYKLKSGELHPYELVETGTAHYRVRDVTAEFVQIGCHKFNRAYLDKFYNKLVTLEK